MVFVRTHNMLDVKKFRCRIEFNTTRPKLSNGSGKVTSFRFKELLIVGEGRVELQRKTDVCTDVLLILGDVFVSGLDYFDSSSCTLPRKSEIFLIKSLCDVILTPDSIPRSAIAGVICIFFGSVDHQKAIMKQLLCPSWINQGYWWQHPHLWKQYMVGKSFSFLINRPESHIE